MLKKLFLQKKPSNPVNEGLTPTQIMNGVTLQTPPHLFLEDSTIAVGRYRNAVNLKTVKFGPQTARIGCDAFRDCGLTELHIPDTVNRIDRSAFRGCKSLSAVYAGQNLRVIPAECFRDCSNLRQITLPQSLERIGYAAFRGCTALEELILPRGVREIATAAFAGCSSLKRIVLPEGLTELDVAVFENCTSLEVIVLPATVETVSRYAFCGCCSLRTVVHPRIDAFESALLDTPFWKMRHPDCKPVVRLPLEVTGTHRGEWLLERGYRYFKPDREYSIRLPDENGVVEVSSWCGDDGPDEDGYGREEYYDWWLMDEALCPIPGVPMLHSYSHQDLRANEERWKSMKQQAADVLRRRK